MNALVLAVLLAQYTNPYSGVSWNNPMSSYLDTALYNRIWSRAVTQGVGAKTAKVATAEVKAAAPQAALTATDFKPAGPRTIAAQLVAQSKGVTREQGLALVTGLNAGIDVFEKEARKNNVAYAMAFLIGVSVQVATETEVPDAQAEALAQAINDELAAAPVFKKATAKQKQQLYETCIVVGALIGGMAAQAAESNDEALKGQAKQMAQSALATFSGR